MKLNNFVSRLNFQIQTECFHEDMRETVIDNFGGGAVAQSEFSQKKLINRITRFVSEISLKGKNDKDKWKFVSLENNIWN